MWDRVMGVNVTGEFTLTRAVQVGKNPQRILDLLVRYETREHAQPSRPVIVTRYRHRQVRRRVDSVVHHGDPVVVDTEFDELARRRRRHRHIPVATVDPRRDPRLEEPPQSAEESAGHRPLLAVHVVNQHDDRSEK